MKREALAVLLPDQSARIMRDELANGLRTTWQNFCAGAQLHDFDLDRQHRGISAEYELQLQRSFAALTANSPDVWLRLGLRYRLMAYGALGMAMMTARDLSEALKVGFDHQELSFSLLTYRRILEGGELSGVLVDDSAVPADLRTFLLHRDLGAIKRLLDDLSGSPFTLDRVQVAAPEPAGWDAARAHFDCPVEFNCSQTIWRLKPGAGQTPLALADSQFQDIYASQCKLLLHDADRNAGLADRLHDMMVRMKDGFPSATEAARSLGMSERTMHRHLAEQNTNYSVIVDRAKCQRACRLIQFTDLSLEQIAAGLNFADCSSFTRAFKRWTAMTPGAFRKHKPNVLNNESIGWLPKESFGSE